MMKADKNNKLKKKDQLSPCWLFFFAANVLSTATMRFSFGVFFSFFSLLLQNVAISIMPLPQRLTDECVPSAGWWSCSVLWSTAGKPQNVSPHIGWSNRDAVSDFMLHKDTCVWFIFLQIIGRQLFRGTTIYRYKLHKGLPQTDYF